MIHQRRCGSYRKLWAGPAYSSRCAQSSSLRPSCPVSRGVIYLDADETEVLVPAIPVQVVDTTAAGDTFVGYLLSGLVAGDSLRASVERASKAASIAVQTLGASNSIPDSSML